MHLGCRFFLLFVFFFLKYSTLSIEIHLIDSSLFLQFLEIMLELNPGLQFPCISSEFDVLQNFLVFVYSFFTHFLN